MGRPKGKVWRKEDGWSFFNVKADINTSPPNPAHKIIFSARHRLLQTLCGSLWSFPLIAVMEEAGLSENFCSTEVFFLRRLSHNQMGRCSKQLPLWNFSAITQGQSDMSVFAKLLN